MAGAALKLFECVFDLWREPFVCLSAQCILGQASHQVVARSPLTTENRSQANELNKF